MSPAGSSRIVTKTSLVRAKWHGASFGMPRFSAQRLAVATDSVGILWRRREFSGRSADLAAGRIEDPVRDSRGLPALDRLADMPNLQLRKVCLAVGAGHGESAQLADRVQRPVIVGTMRILAGSWMRVFHLNFPSPFFISQQHSLRAQFCGPFRLPPGAAGCDTSTIHASRDSTFFIDMDRQSESRRAKLNLLFSIASVFPRWFCPFARKKARHRVPRTHQGE